MAVSPLLSLGARAMNANVAALQVIGNNIANANTVGYSRQSAQFETAGEQSTGSGYFGRGVNVTTVARAHSDFLTREAAATRSVASADAARSAQLQQLESVFQIGDAGIGYAAGQLFNSFVDVSNRPQDLSARQVVLARAGDVASRFRAASEQIGSLQAGVTLELKTSVASINTLTQSIAALNVRIANSRGSGHAPNDLLDQRDNAINDLSQYLQVTTVAADDGSTSVFMANGQKLVLGGSATSLVTLPDAADPAKLQLGVDDGGAMRAFARGAVAGGSVAGLLQFQNSDLPDARRLLDELAVGISSGLNQQQALGLDLNGNPGAPIFSGATAAELRVALADPKGIAAASPVSATLAPRNAGTATIASLRASSNSLDANLVATLTFSDDNGNYNYSLIDSSSVLPPTTGSGTFSAGQPIELNGWSLQLAGVPRSGDAVSVGKTAAPAGNNGNANALLALRDAPLVGGQSVTDAYASALATIGVRVQSAKAAADQSAGIATDAKTAQASQSGVNLDEEAARLIQFQQSYQAAAKMLQVAQTVFDTLLQVVAR